MGRPVRQKKVEAKRRGRKPLVTLFYQTTLRVFHCKVFMESEWHERTDVVFILCMLVQVPKQTESGIKWRKGDKKKGKQTSHRLQTKY